MLSSCKILAFHWQRFGCNHILRPLQQVEDKIGPSSWLSWNHALAEPIDVPASNRGFQKLCLFWYKTSSIKALHLPAPWVSSHVVHHLYCVYNVNHSRECIPHTPLILVQACARFISIFGNVHFGCGPRYQYQYPSYLKLPRLATSLISQTAVKLDFISIDGTRATNSLTTITIAGLIEDD